MLECLQGGAFSFVSVGHPMACAIRGQSRRLICLAAACRAAHPSRAVSPVVERHLRLVASGSVVRKSRTFAGVQLDRGQATDRPSCELRSCGRASSYRTTSERASARRTAAAGKVFERHSRSELSGRSVRRRSCEKLAFAAPPLLFVSRASSRFYNTRAQLPAREPRSPLCGLLDRGDAVRTVLEAQELVAFSGAVYSPGTAHASVGHRERPAWTRT